MMDKDQKAGGGCPMHGPQDPSIYKESDLTYGSYLKVDELLSLQVPQSDPAHHDEMLFIVIHQAYELWFKLILHELETAREFMNKDKVLRAHHFMKRVGEVMRVLVQQIHILETMTPAEFLEFRDRLMPASGFQSLQFREVEFLAGLKDRSYMRFFQNRPEMIEKLERRYAEQDLRDAYYGMLRRLGYKIPENASTQEALNDSKAREEVLRGLHPIYKNPDENLQVYLLSEVLVDFDQYLALWREHHVRVVERVIGFKRGTGGSGGVSYLQSTTSKKCFPLLWEVRTILEKEV